MARPPSLNFGEFNFQCLPLISESECGDIFPCVPPGAMGVVMGHELSHAYDDQGRQYDAEGNMVNTTKDF